jgi:hypothetical protein
MAVFDNGLESLKFLGINFEQRLTQANRDSINIDFLERNTRLANTNQFTLLVWHWLVAGIPSRKSSNLWCSPRVLLYH